jgi:hypothetical protein
MSEFPKNEPGSEYPKNINTNILIRDHTGGRELYEMLQKLEKSLDDSGNQETDLVLRTSLFSLQEFKENQTSEYLEELTKLETMVVNLRNAKLRNNEESVATIRSEIKEKFIGPYEFSERLIQSRLEELIERYAERVNEGGNAYIFKVDFGLVPIELVRELGLPETGSENAIKILKFFRPGTMKREIKKQELFYKVLRGVHENLPVAEVPEPIGYYTLRIAEQVQDFNVTTKQPLTVEVSSEHIDVLVGKKLPLSSETGEDASGQTAQRRLIEVELAVMDYVNGKDIATLMMEWILNNPPAGKERKVIPPTFNELRLVAMDLLEISPQEDGAGDEPGVQMFMQKEIFEHLKSTGFKTNPEVINQLVNTKKVLDENKLRHPDAHSRNVMISGDIHGQNQVKTHLIDFGEVNDVDTKDLEAIIVLLKRLNTD